MENDSKKKLWFFPKHLRRQITRTTTGTGTSAFADGLDLLSHNFSSEFFHIIPWQIGLVKLIYSELNRLYFSRLSRTLIAPSISSFVVL